MAKTNLAIKEETSTAVAMANGFDDVTDGGFGELSASDFAIPRLAILGDLSPQVKESNAKYIEGAKPGMIADVGLAELVPDNSLHFLPVQRVKEWIEWHPRKSGKGIANRFTHDRIAELGLTRNDRNEFLTKEGTEIIEHHSFYGLNLSQDNRFSFISMKKSNLRVARQFMTKASMLKMPNGRQAPLFWKSYIFTTFLDGTDPQWFNWKISDGPLAIDLPDSAEVIELAKKLKELVVSGAASGDLRDDDPASDEAPF